MIVNVYEAVTSRRAVRGFIGREVPREVLERVLAAARWSPSGSNLQPWHVYVLTGEPLAELKRRAMERVATGDPVGRARIRDVPARAEVPVPRAPIGLRPEQRYGALGVPRDDWEARQRAASANWECFGAPAALFCYIDADMGPPQWADVGMYLQTVMLLLRAEGLHSCPQMAWSVYRSTVAEVLSPPEGLVLFCGLSIGYEDVTVKHPGRAGRRSTRRSRSSSARDGGSRRPDGRTDHEGHLQPQTALPAYGDGREMTGGRARSRWACAPCPAPWRWRSAAGACSGPRRSASDTRWRSGIRPRPDRRHLGGRAQRRDRRRPPRPGRTLAGPCGTRARRRDVFPFGHLPARGGVFADRGLRGLIASAGLPARIEDLAVPFTAVAMDLATGAPALLDHGDLESALLASAAIPGVLPPVEREGRTLVDGGMIAYLPVLAALRAGAASVVVLPAGPVGPPRFPARLPRRAGAVAARAGLLLWRHQIERDLHEVSRRIPTVVLPTGVDAWPAPWDFRQSQRLIDTARLAAGRFLDGLHVSGPGLYGVDGPLPASALLEVGR